MPDYNDPVLVAKRRRNLSSLSSFPAVNQFGLSGVAAGAGYSLNQGLGALTAQQMFNQDVPVGGFGIGTLNDTAGYSRAGNPFDIFGDNQTSTAPPTSRLPFVNGGYNFPAGSVLPEGFQENGGGGLTRQIPQDDGNQATTHFLPPGFTATTGSTGVRGSTENDIHFLPPGFTAVTGTNGQNKQLQFQPNQNRTWLGGGY